MQDKSYSFIIDSYGLSILFFGIFSYVICLLLLFNVFFFFNLNRIRVLTDLKKIISSKFLIFSLVISLLIIAGIPPFLGFVSKLLLFLYLLTKNSNLILIFFTIINLFALYFYLQNVKYVISRAPLNNTFFLLKKKNNTTDKFFILVFILIFSIFSIFFINDLLIVFVLWCCFI